MNGDSTTPTGRATTSLGGAHAMTPVAALSYEAPPAESAVSPRVIELFRQTRPWTLFLAILGFIGSGLMVLGGVGMGIVAAFTHQFQPALLGVGYLIFALLAVFPSLALYRYATRIKELGRLRREVELEGAIDAQRAVWKLYGILTIVAIGLYIIGIAALFLTVWI